MWLRRRHWLLCRDRKEFSSQRRDPFPLGRSACLTLFGHVLRKIHSVVPGRFWALQRAAPVGPFAGQHTSEFVRQPFVLAEEITVLSPAYADVAGRHVGMWTDVPEQFRHKRLTKAH